MTIGLVGVVGVSATRAYFSDSAINSSNTFTAGTLDLKLNDSDSTSAVWALSNMAPGDAVTATINLKNTGSLAANHVEVSVVNTIIDALPDATPNIDAKLEITALTYDGSPILTSISDSNLNGWKDLADLEAVGLDNLSAPVSGGAAKPLLMTV